MFGLLLNVTKFKKTTFVQGRRQQSKNGVAEDCWGTCKDVGALLHALCPLREFG